MTDIDEYLKGILEQILASYKILAELNDQSTDIEMMKKEIAKIRGLLQVIRNKLNEKKQDSKTNQMRNAFSSFSLNDRKRIQGKLREYGYESQLDGIWGPGTLSAVRRYLSRNEIQSSADLESVLKTLLGD